MTKEQLIELKKKIGQLSEEELKERDLYLRGLATGEIQGPPVGYASVDKPWLKYYNFDEFIKEKRKRTVYQEVYENNKDHLDDLAIEFFGSKIKYRDFFSSVQNTAKAFRKIGVKKGDFVTICAAGIPETAYSFYALSIIGGIANMISPYFDKKDLVDRIEDCQSDILVVMDTFYDEIKETIKNSRIKKIIVLPTLNSSMLRFFKPKYSIDKDKGELYWNQFIKEGLHSEEETPVDYVPNMPLAMVYSSGTTGASKGILLSNDSFQNSIQSYPASGVDISRGQKFYQIIPTWFSTGLITSLHLPLSYGTSVFMDPRFERKVFVKNIIKSKTNYAVAPTSMYEGFLDRKLVGKHDLSFFNYPFEGGEPLREEVATQIENVFKEHGNTAKLRVAYGQCECGAAVSTQTQKNNHSQGSVGIPIPGVILSILDENKNENMYNSRGVVYAKTPCSMIGYYNNPSATNEYFYIDENGDKWNCTGDVGYIDENGELYIEGRESDHTNINGKKIYNFDIENVLFSIPEIKLCDVIGYKDDKGCSYLVAHIIFTEDFVEKIRNNSVNLLEELESIQRNIYLQFNDVDMVPYIFKIRESFPYAKSGKRDMGKLKNETDGFIEIGKYNPGFQRKLKQDKN